MGNGFCFKKTRAEGEKCRVAQYLKPGARGFTFHVEIELELPLVEGEKPDNPKKHPWSRERTNTNQTYAIS